MESAIDQPGAPAPSDASTWVPAFPRGLLRNVAIDMAMPWAALQLLTRVWGMSSVSALALAAIFPAASMLAGWRRQRRIDFIGLVVLVTLIGAVALALATQDIRFAVLKPAVAAALFGGACLVSLGRKTPLMFFLARQVTAGDDAAKHSAWTARLDSSPGFRQAMRVLTLVWGLALLTKAGLWAAAALFLTADAMVIVAPVLGLGLFAALMAWTIAFARRGAARIAAGEN